MNAGGTTGKREIEWSAKQVAAHIRMSPDWVYDRAEDGTLPAYRYGERGRWRFDPAAIRAWLADQKRPRASR